MLIVHNIVPLHQKQAIKYKFIIRRMVRANKAGLPYLFIYS